MEIKYYGHSCFRLTNASGTRVLMDPMDPSTGYDLKDIETDIITSSHDHRDHNYFAAASGAPVIIRDAGVHELMGIRIIGIPSWHDASEGKQRGSNMIYIVEMDGMRIMHAGDLGALPDAKTKEAIGGIDVLLAPIGGYYTIDGNEARALGNMLRPKVLIPMHYNTPNSTSKVLAELQPFLNSAVGCSVHRLRESEATLTKETLGVDRLIALDYER